MREVSVLSFIYYYMPFTSDIEYSQANHVIIQIIYDGASKSFRTESITK